MREIFIMLITFFAFTSFSYGADSADFIVVIDQSRSITANMPVIKQYIKKSIVGDIAGKDDTVYLFSFDGKFYFEKKLPGKSDMAETDRVLENINPVGMFTDLTNAVENMRMFIQEKTDPKKKKIVFFLTDGLNDPPSFSPYREGLNHRFFKESKKTVMDGGWRVFVTGIGEKTDGSTVASLVGAEYVELSASPELSEFDKKLTERLKDARKGWSIWWYIGGFLVILIAGAGTYIFIRR